MSEPLSSAVIVENWANIRKPGADEVCIQDLVALSGHTTAHIKHVLSYQKIEPDRVDSHRWFAKWRIPALLDTIVHSGRHPAGYLTTYGLAVILGITRLTLVKEIHNGRMKPDLVNFTGSYLFRKDQIARHIESWKTRHETYPTWASETVITTPFGIIRPRSAPRAEVFVRLMLALPKKRSRRSSSRGPTTNLEDLLRLPLRPPSMTIFRSTSLKSVQAQSGKKSRSRT